MWTKLKLLLWKNLLIRKRHWILTITEILLPILLFSLVAYGRSKISGMNKVMKEATFPEPISVQEIDYHLPISGFNLWYSPYTDFTESIITKVQEKFQIPGEAIKDFTSEEDLLNHFTKNSSSTIAAIIFRGNDPRKLNYDISIHDKYLTWNTDKLFMPMITNEEVTGSSMYLYKGFAALQIAIDTAFMEMYLDKDQSHVNFFIQEFPYPPHSFDSGLTQMFIYFLPLVTIFSFVFLCPAVLQRVGEEQKSGSKEFLKLVGVQSWMIWLTWFIHALISNMISIIAIIILMKVPLWGVSYPPIEYSDGVVLFLFLFLYCMAAITFCFLIATIISTPTVATIVGILIWIFSYFIPQAIISSKENISWIYKISLAIFPNMALHYGYSAISVYEMREVGIQWCNIFESGSGGETDITMGNIFICFLIEMLIFMSLSLYIENVKPGKYGIAKPLHFPLINVKNWIKYICSTLLKRKIDSKVEQKQELKPLDKLEEGRPPKIEIKNLKKKFYNNVAVDGLNMDIYNNCITVLLGHNGAGKTTTMSLLTGMINSSEGYIKINGKDIRTHTDEVRKNMGLCTQHNLLFPDLTASEHLQFFGMLKGKSSKVAKEKAKEMLKKFNIGENDMSNDLSGGQKRKLCLGMALIGDAEVLILDEPTSGMDPESRREVWNMLLEIKKYKTILISTHFMEEADVLGDRIAIMANGSLQCYDTPLRLKNRYNTGYHLSLMLKSDGSLKEITNNITNILPEAELLRENGDNVVYLLPLQGKELYAKLFNTLEKNKDKWGIVTMGLSITTLEDVFLKARKDITAKDVSETDGFCNQDGADPWTKTNGNSKRFMYIFFSLLLKRYYFFKRKFYWYLPALIVCICIFLVTMWLGMSSTDYYSYGGSKLNLSLNAYGKTSVLYGGKENPASRLISDMKNHYYQAALNDNGQPVHVEDVSEGILQRGIDNIAYYKKHMIVAAEFNRSMDNDIIVKAMYSSTALHSLPISINLAMNAVIRSVLNESFSISVSNVPLKPLYTDFSPSELSAFSVGLLWLILVPIGMLFLLSSFIIFPNVEISSNFIQIQIIAGVRTWTYWLTNVLFDFITYLLKLLVLFLIITFIDFLVFDSKYFKSSELRTLITMFVCYGVTSLPFVYLFSYRKTICNGFTRFVMFGIFTGITPTVAVLAMELSGDDNYIDIGKYVKHVFLCTSPQFGLHYVCTKFALKYVQNFNWIYMNPYKKKYLCEREPNPCCLGDTTLECFRYQNYFSNEKFGISDDLLEMIVPFFVYFALLWFLNTESCEKIVHCLKYLSCSFSSNVNDETDQAENSEIKLAANNLKKSFGKKHVINKLKLKLKKQKCFGLLGVNGAGKSTTFRMLTKNTFFDEGEITLSKTTTSDSEDPTKKITISDPEYSEQIGYCPQENYLNYFLTGYENLRIIALMKGASLQESKNLSNLLLKKFELETYAHKPCLEYSGGNKRKLSTCIAFLGFPNVILFDEPTSGVDPASRRNFWNILSNYKKTKDVSLLLCSHSMEECEALCDEIGILKKGCITHQGTLMKLKNDHEKGYKIELKLKCSPENIVEESEKIVEKGEKNCEKDKKIREKAEKLGQEIRNMINNAKCELTESYSESLKYHIEESATLSKLFTSMEELKKRHEDLIDDYIINQVSLEDVFLSVAKEE